MSDLKLSPRQAEVCLLVVAGESPKAIADEMGISVHTVNTHIENAAARIRKAYPELAATEPRRLIRRYYIVAVASNPFASEDNGESEE